MTLVLCQIEVRLRFGAATVPVNDHVMVEVASSPGIPFALAHRMRERIRENGWSSAYCGFVVGWDLKKYLPAHGRAVF